jgi:hypothetical protein
MNGQNVLEEEDVFWLGNNIPLPMFLPSRRSPPHPSMAQDPEEDYEFYCKVLRVDKPWAHRYADVIMQGLALGLPTLFSGQSMFLWRQRLEEIMTGLPATLLLRGQRSVSISGVDFQSPYDEIRKVLRGKKLVFLIQRPFLQEDETLDALPSHQGPELYFTFTCLLRCSLAPDEFKFLQVNYYVRVDDE